VFGISAPEFIVLLAVAAVVLGPERMPHYAQQLGRLIRELRRMAQGASQQVRTEMGPEFDDIDWRKFDPRQYDPRRIVRDALADTFDPDDPLGLKEMDKPVSEGGPTSWGNGNGNGSGTSASTDVAIPDPPAEPERPKDKTPDRSTQPPFDIDAT
jgi:sec-independent protein translocase protein TatB